MTLFYWSSRTLRRIIASPCSADCYRCSTFTLVLIIFSHAGSRVLIFPSTPITIGIMSAPFIDYNFPISLVKLSFLFSFFFVCIYMLLSSEYAMSITIHVVSFSFTIFRPRCLFKCSHLIIASLRILEFSLSVTRGISSYSVFALCRLWFPRNSQWIILSTLACHNLYQVYLLMPLTTHPAFVSIACIVHSIFHISFLTFLLELRS